MRVVLFMAGVTVDGSLVLVELPFVAGLAFRPEVSAE